MPDIGEALREVALRAKALGLGDDHGLSVAIGILSNELRKLIAGELGIILQYSHGMIRDDSHRHIYGHDP